MLCYYFPVMYHAVRFLVARMNPLFYTIQYVDRVDCTFNDLDEPGTADGATRKILVWSPFVSEKVYGHFLPFYFCKGICFFFF